MKHKYFALILFGILFVACKQEKPLSEYMVENWQTSYIKIDMPTYKKSDSTFVYEDDFSKADAALAKSSYVADGSFTAWYETKGKPTVPTKGTWSAKKDSLFISYFYDGRTVNVAYKIEKTEEGFLGKSIYDWDEDGEFDDTLIMKTKRITAPVKVD